MICPPTRHHRVARLAARALLSAALLLPGGVAAQTSGTLLGRVTESGTGRPLSGITVQVEGQGKVAITDPEGRYAFPSIPAGEHTVRFGWLGYRSRDATVDVTSGARAVLDVQLEATPIQLGEILVTTVSRQAERVVESPAAVAAVEPRRIQDMALSGSTPRLVGTMPGVYVSQSGSGDYNIGTRGFNKYGNRNMLILVDGRDVAGPIAGSPEWPDIQVLDEAAKVELIRGPGSALYGANAYNGVLNIISPTVREAQGTRVTVAGGELSTFRFDARHGLVTSDLRWGLRIGGGYARTGSWEEARTDVGDLKREYADAGVDPSGVTAPQPGFDALPLPGQTKGTPFGVPGPASGEPDPLTTAHGSARVDHYLTGGGVLTFAGGVGRIENQVIPDGGSRTAVLESTRPWARFAAGNDAFNVMGYYTGRDGTQIQLGSGTEFREQSGVLHLEAQGNRHFLDDRGRVVVGASVRRVTVDSRGTFLAAADDGRADRYYAAFGQAELELTDHVKVVATARVDDATLFDPQFSPKAALVVSPDETQSFRVGVSRGYLMPNAIQRFLSFPVALPQDLSLLEAGLRASPLGPALLGVPQGTLFTNSGAVPFLARGNPDLPPQTITGLEAGYKRQSDRVFVTADVFYNRMKDFHSGILPGANPAFGPWTAPDGVPEAARGALEQAVLGAVGSALTRLPDGSTALVVSAGAAGEATVWGTEFGLGIQASDPVRLDVGYSFQRSTIDGSTFLPGDSVLSNTPEHQGNVGVTFEPDARLRVSATLTLVSAFDFKDGFWVGRVPSRQSLDVTASRAMSDDLRVTVDATNLLDQRRYQFYGAAVIGRRVLVGLTWTH
jgi:iron complex outermembrane receptor protein